MDKGGCVFEGSISYCICEVSLVTRLESAKIAPPGIGNAFETNEGFSMYQNICTSYHLVQILAVTEFVH